MDPNGGSRNIPHEYGQITSDKVTKAIKERKNNLFNKWGANNVHP